MANEELLISGIAYKVRKLVENIQLLKVENERLRSDLQARNEQFKSLQEVLNKKNNELIKLSLANALENKFGVEKGIQMIDQLMEEIDRSIDVISD